MRASQNQDSPVIEVDGIVTRFGDQTVHNGVSFSLQKGSITALIGGSGTGKSVLLREIIGLLRPDAGSVSVLGTDMWNSSERDVARARQRFGMMFQDGALFSALTVAQNVLVPLKEHSDVPEEMLEQLVDLRLAQAGLPLEAGDKLPSQLSGGMRKRAAIARALALEPEVLLLDEPTSGLDPITARSFDSLIRSLVDNIGLSVLVVTHDLDTLLTVVDRIIVLSKGKVLADGLPAEIVQYDDPWLRAYFSARRMVKTEQKETRGK